MRASLFHRGASDFVGRISDDVDCDSFAPLRAAIGIISEISAHLCSTEQPKNK